MSSEINRLREKIDALDAKIQALIQDRGELAKQVARVKKKIDAHNFYRPEREVAVLRKVLERNAGGLLPDKSMTHIFREIMSACLAIEKPLKIAYLGPEGTFTQEAALMHFGHAVATLDCAGIDEIFHQVEKGNADYGVVPIENSSNGVIGATIDLLYSQKLKICGEVEIFIQHQLMAKNAKAPIQKIYAHQQSLEQCRRWLANHYPDAELCALSSNALAARRAQKEAGAAAIASESALSLYGLERVAKNIEDKPGNMTRFLIIGTEAVAPGENDKTSLLLVAKHHYGALCDLLEPFKKHHINLHQLARHPIPGVRWEYLFFIDIEGHADDKPVREALKEVGKRAVKMEILGSYPTNTIS